MKRAVKNISGGAKFYGVLVGVVGLTLLVGGVNLLLLGGSPYYALAGMALVGTGGAFWRAPRRAVIAYLLFLGVTIAWAIWESGLDPWGLMPRLAFLVILALPSLLLIATDRVEGPAPRRWKLALVAGMVGSVALGLMLHSALGTEVRDPVFDRGTANAGQAIKDQGATKLGGEWRNYGNDAGGMRFSPLEQVSPSNVNELEVAWTFRTGPGIDGKFGNLEVTPLKVGNLLYACTSYSDVVALDAETGRQVWRWKARVDRKGFPYHNCRGVSYYEVPGASGMCAKRIIHAVLDAHLVALDASNGRSCQDFGDHGRVSLAEGMGPLDRGYYFVTSAPTVVRGRIVVGGWVADGQYWGEPSGAIRAFDAKSGAFAWAFDVGRPGETSQPAKGETYTRSTPNSWAPMSADEDLGLVYAPTGNSVPDYYGGNRRSFDDRYSTAVVAIDVLTGLPRWVYQTVHHDLWDYDNASQPTLVDLPLAGVVRRALIQPTKRGELFVLDRATGKPIFPIEERRVPQGGIVPGERLSPTQPFSVSMPSLTGPALQEKLMWGLTPVDQLLCRIAFREHRYEGQFTPPGLKANLLFPSFGGGMNWGGVSIDADRRLLIVNSIRMPTGSRLMPRAEADLAGIVPMSDRSHTDIGGSVAQARTPYAAEVKPFLSPLMMPCTQPHYGFLTAIDLNTQKVVWTRPLGDSRGSGPLGIPTGVPLPVGMPNLGGSVVTRGGLVFISGTSDRMLRAFTSTTGQLLWQHELPAGGNATPMTYFSASSGRQFIVIAAGGHYAVQSRPGDYIVAYALPKTALRR